MASARLFARRSRHRGFGWYAESPGAMLQTPPVAGRAPVLPRRIHVAPGECVLAYRRGERVATLGPGAYWTRGGTSSVRIDLRERLTTLAPQESPLADGVQVRVTAALTWRVVDAAAFHEQAGDPEAALYLAVQVALRDALAPATSDTVLAGARDTAALSERTRATVASTAARWGVAVQEVVVRDLLAPPELRRAAADVVAARQRGLASLEAARAETAALRALANAAKLLDAHPALARLRTVQAAPDAATVVLHLGERG